MVSAQVLRKFPGFTKAIEHTVRSVAVMSHERRYGPGEHVFEEGEPAENVCLLLDGAVDLSMQLNDHHTVIDSVMPGGFLCWSALMDPYVITATGVARVASRVIEIDGAELRWIFDRDASLGFYLMREAAGTLCSRLRSVHLRLAAC